MTSEELFYQEAERLNARMDALLNNTGDIPLNSEYVKLKNKYSNEIKAEIADMKKPNKPVEVRDKYPSKPENFDDISYPADHFWTVPDPNAPAEP